MKTNKIIKFLFLIFLSLSSFSACKVIEIDVATQTKCIVTFNTNGGSYIPNQELKKGDRIQKPENPIKEGHSFTNWTYQGREWDFFGYTVSEDMTLDANWNTNQYNLILKRNIREAGFVYGGGMYDYNEQVTIEAESTSYYIFLGWYEDDELVSTSSIYTFNMPSRNINYEARYKIKEYTINLNNQAEGVTISGVTSGNSYDCGTNIILKASNIPSNYTIRWERNDGEVYFGNNYTFNMPLYSITITITISSLQDVYFRENAKIYFGKYPQTEVKDMSLISELNMLAGEKPTSSNTYNWTDYNYYVNGSISSYMFYQDIDVDSDGTYDYRGVYFTQYRPYMHSCSSSINNTNQEDNGYSRNTIYWFSYEFIEWDILKEENNKALIIANLILDSQDYYPNEFNEIFNHNGGEGYANNYELSNIRKFLNDNFYNIAFNELQKEIIEIIKVDNSTESTSSNSNRYTCNDTNDKMFLLSYMDVKNKLDIIYLFTQGSDYAKSQGLYVKSSNGNSYWWLRTPFESLDNYVYYIGAGGSENEVGYLFGNRPCCYNNCGVRPACQIIL